MKYLKQVINKEQLNWGWGATLEFFRIVGQERIQNLGHYSFEFFFLPFCNDFPSSFQPPNIRMSQRSSLDFFFIFIQFLDPIQFPDFTYFLYLLLK